jgi:cysteine-rich repeat protein
MHATFVVAAVAAARPAWPWPVTLQGDLDIGNAVHTVAVDSAGNVIVAGYVQNNLSTVGGLDFIVAKLAAEDGAELWRYVESDTGWADAVRVDANDDVVVTGRSFVSGVQSFVVAKLASADGSLLWRHDQLDGTAWGHALALDSTGDPIAAGIAAADFAVVKVAGSNGALSWNGALGGTPGRAYTVAVDGGDDVLAGGEIVDGLTPEGQGNYDFAVFKLDGSSGAETWRHVISGPYRYERTRTLAADASGDVVAAGWLSPSSTEIDFTVMKLAAGDGDELWRVQLNPTGSDQNGAFAVGVDASGDVLAGGILGTKYAVLKRSGADGSEIWTTTFPSVEDGVVIALRVLANGDVVTSGIIDHRFVVATLAGSTGAVQWTRMLPDGIAVDVAVDSSGDVAAGGSLEIPPVYGDVMAAAKLEGNSGRTLGCGDGDLDVGEQCDDGNTLPDDGCGTDCTHDICLGGTDIVGARITIANVFRPIGDETMHLQGRLAFPPGSPFDFNPGVEGAQVLVEDLGQGPTRIFELSSRTVPIPGSVIGACDPGDGWRVKTAGATYRNRSNRMDPPECSFGSARRLKKLKMDDRREVSDEIRFKLITSKGGVFSTDQQTHIVVPTGPLRVTVVVSADLEAGQQGACGTVTFAPEQCSLNGTTFTCQ